MARVSRILFLLVVAAEVYSSSQSGFSTGLNCIRSCWYLPNGDYQSCNGCNVYASCSNWILYDNRPCPVPLVWDDILKRCEWTSPTCNFMPIYSSCIEAYYQNDNPPNGEYILDNGNGELYVVYCEFFLDRIYTYIAKTELTTINIDDLYNNNNEILVRHKRTDGVQYQVVYGQISDFADIDISIQYNSNIGYNNISNIAMSPYLYVGLLETSSVNEDDTNGYRVNETDVTFINCDGNQNNYFVLLFNAANVPTTGRVAGDSQGTVSRWKTDAFPLPSSRNIADKFFVQWEIHFGGCGGYLTSDHLSDVEGVSFGLCYDIPLSSCFDVYNRNHNPSNGEYTIDNGNGETYVVYCEFFPDRIYTYIAKTDLITINIDDLYNNNNEILVRHKRTDGIQYQVVYGQISAFADINITIQYNSNIGYNNITNIAMSPYLYVGLLETSSVNEDDTNGYRVNETDVTFINCDGNQNNYFVLLFNAANVPTTGRVAGDSQGTVSRWKTDASPLPSDRNIADKFFVQWEIHFGGCGGYLTSDHLSDVEGVTFGLCYGLTFSSCLDVYYQNDNPPNGEYTIDNGNGETYVVYCEFFPDRIYTYIAKTDLTTINIGDLYNNNNEILVRHKRTDGIQYQVVYGQISDFADINITIQYNSNIGYNNITNIAMSPYLYVGLLETSSVNEDDTNGYRVNETDVTFINCDGNQNNYFVLLFNAANVPTTGRVAGDSQGTVSRWKTDASPLPSDRNIADKFFVQWEIHFGGCGGYLTSDHLSDVEGVSFGLCYDLPPTSCFDVYSRNENPSNGEYTIDNGKGETYVVYCEFFPDRIYTYIAKTDLITINIDDLYNNNNEILVRHKRTDGIQYQVVYGQISDFADINITIQYNSNIGYNNITNIAMSPYLYVGLLETSSVNEDDTNGYRVNETDVTFINCDGNQNNYFVLLFNAANVPTTGRVAGDSQGTVSRWKTDASPLPSDRNIADKFFVQWEIHFGGCGGYLTSDHLSDVEGVSFGLCYDLPPTSCFDVYSRNENPSNGEYTIDNGKGETYVVYCEFFPDRIYTYIAKTDLTTINIDDLYNNNNEILVRHKRTDGIQYQVVYGQISDFADIDISIQYNSNIGYNNITNIAMSPYLYVGLLETSSVNEDDTNGYRVNETDVTFINCDGNQNNYFVLLFNAANVPTTGRVAGDSQGTVSRWKTDASPLPSDRNIDDKFFVQWEIHFGGCGGYLTSDHLSDVEGVSFGLCYDL